MKPSLHMTMKQTISLSPKLQQAIRLLQLSAGELEAEIKVALDTNPLLEVIEDWDENTTTNVNHDFIYEATNTTTTLHEYLLWQLNLTPFTDRDHLIAITLLDSISDDGYLSASLEEISASLKHNYLNEFAEIEIAEILAVLHRLQQFDPPGVAARDLRECMILQLQALGIADDILAHCKLLITNHLELFAQKEYAKLKKLMHINDQELTAISEQIKRLHPKPGLIISVNNTEYIVPDVIAEKINNKWHITLKTNLAQNLRINNNYAYDNASLRKQYIEAQWLLDSIKNRNTTLLKVASFIIRYQNPFLEHGETEMRPLILHEIAAELGLSESTISRITSRKYIHTPRGTYELKFFFSSHIPGNSEECSSTAVKGIIKQLISQETNTQPLSDQELTELIAQRGINVARRTVAKYRESLGIQSSNQRGT